MKNFLDEEFEKQIFAAVKSAVGEVGLDAIKAGPFFGIKEAGPRAQSLGKAA